MIQFNMELNRVIIAYKKTLHKLPADSSKRLTGRARPVTSSLKYSEMLAKIASKLAKHDIKTRFVDRNRLGAMSGADLIVSLGGDGTVLAAAHAAGKTPILGVNFMPSNSVGFFCSADLNNFERVLREILEDARKPTLLPMLKVQIDGKMLKNMALNEVLFSSPSPAEMSRYRIHVGGKSESQRSSGVWIAAGPGSTAALASAGGKKVTVDSARLQYLVREPCPLPWEKYKQVQGILKEGQSISICSNMSNAFAYLDGPDLMYPISRNSRLTVRVVKKALRIFL